MPIQATHYDATISNNFCELKSIQVYHNPFEKPLEVHYSIPTDPDFCLSRLTVFYQDLIVEGFVKEKEKVKAEFKESVSKGETVMMANFSKS